MKYFFFYLKGFVCIFFSFQLYAQPYFAESITPRPVKMTRLKGNDFRMNEQTVILYDGRFARQAIYLQEQLEQQCGLRLDKEMLNGERQFQAIRLEFDSVQNNRPEMYQLKVTRMNIQISARDVKGIVNGIQTFLQLLPIGHKSIRVTALEITDYPRFGYRGMHLDVVRHFFPVTYVKKYIDYLTFHKFNSFHWHLTDDQGWRIEMLNYKKLNEIGSWRKATLIGHFRDTPARYDSTRYGGYYSRAEIKEVIEYAAVRGIEIIPEIDIPGHSRAIIAAYPELSTKPDTIWNVATTWGMFNRQNNVLAPKPETFAFLKTVFQEIADLFPSPYFHVGGDECSRIWWKADPVTQDFMKDHGLKDEAALQTYFIEQVAGYLAEKNKKIIGWHEIMEGAPDTSTVVMDWATEKQAVEAARRGYKIIMTPGNPLYFDHYQSKDPGDSLAISGYNPMAAVYAFEPVPPIMVKEGLSEKIMGAQGNVWTEYMAYSTKVDYMVLPRMTALAEVLWTPASRKNYRDFLYRLKRFVLPRYRFWNSSFFTDFEKWKKE
jgi:hexosaminidase